MQFAGICSLKNLSTVMLQVMGEELLYIESQTWLTLCNAEDLQFPLLPP